MNSEKGPKHKCRNCYTETTLRGGAIFIPSKLNGVLWYCPACRHTAKYVAEMISTGEHKMSTVETLWKELHDLCIERKLESLQKDNDAIHELAEHYRVENLLLRERFRTLQVVSKSYRDDELRGLIRRVCTLEEDT